MRRVIPKELRQYALSRRAIEQQANLSSSTSLKRMASGELVDSGSIKRSRSGSSQDDDDCIEIVGGHRADEEWVDDDIVITGFKSPLKSAPIKPASTVSNDTPKPQLGAKDLQLFRINSKALE